MDTLTVMFDRETTDTIRQMAKLAHAPNEEELVRDALNTFRWLLQHQLNGYKIVVYKGDYDHPEDPNLMVNLWEERKAA